MFRAIVFFGLAISAFAQFHGGRSPDWLTEKSSIGARGRFDFVSQLDLVTMCRDCCALPRAEVGRAEDEFAV
jgi:hypothetical protein